MTKQEKDKIIKFVERWSTNDVSVMRLKDLRFFLDDFEDVENEAWLDNKEKIIELIKQTKITPDDLPAFYKVDDMNEFVRLVIYLLKAKIIRKIQQ